MEQDDVLASDAERNQVIARLQDACSEGRLTLDEFSNRVSVALAARTRGQLVPITADLPSGSALARPRLASPKSTTVSLLSDVKRRGRWRIDGETRAISVLGSCTLDLRNALIQGNEVIITTYVVMGSVKIVVPPGTHVEMEGFSVAGSRDSKIDEGNVLPGRPVVRVRGITVMGSVDVVSGEANWWQQALAGLLDRSRERVDERREQD